MPDVRLYRENITFALALPEAFANWQAPTVAELNGALVYNITCAVDEDNTQYDLGDSETDDSLSFCQAAGSSETTYANPEVVFQVFRSRDPLQNNTANRAFGLLAFPDVEYFAVLRINGAPDKPFAVGDRVYLVRVATDQPVDVMGNNENIRMSNSFLNRGDVLWKYAVAA